MNGWSIPAPAPCATIRQALACGGCSSMPETRIATVTSISTALDTEVATLTVCSRSAAAGPHRDAWLCSSDPLDGKGQRTRTGCVILPGRAAAEDLRRRSHGEGMGGETVLDLLPADRHGHGSSFASAGRQHGHGGRDSVVSQIIQKDSSGTPALRHVVKI